MLWGSVFTLAVMLIFFGTAPGKVVLRDLINQYAQGKFKLAELESFFPFKMHIETLQLWDKDSAWLEIQNAHIQFDLTLLLLERGLAATVKIENLVVSSLPAENGESSGFPEALPISLDLRLKLDRLEIREPVVGPELSLALPESFIKYYRLDHSLSFGLQATTQSFGSLLTCTTHGSGTLQNFTMRLEAQTPELKYQQIDVTDVSAQVNLKGLPLHPQGHLDVKFLYGEDPGQLQVQGLQTDGTWITIENASFNGWKAQVNAKLRYNISTTSAEATYQGQIEDLKSLSTLLPVELDGQLAFQGNAHLDPNVQSLSAEVSAKEFAFDTIAIQDSQASLKMTLDQGVPSGQIAIEAKDFNLSGFALEEIRLNSELHQGRGAFDLQIRSPEVDLQSKSSLRFQDLYPTATVNTFEGNAYKQAFHISEAFDVTILEAGAKLGPVRLMIADIPFSFAGSYLEETLDCWVKGLLDLGLLAKVLLHTGDLLDGQINIDITVQGSLQDPKVQGEMVLEDGVYENVEFGTRLKNFAVKIQAESLESLSLTGSAQDDFEGQISLAGTWKAAGSQYQVQLDVQQFRLFNTDFLTSTIGQASIELSGDLSKAKLSGHIELQDAAYDLSRELFVSIETLNVINQFGTLAQDQEVLEQKTPGLFPIDIFVDLDIAAPQNIKVYGRGLSSQWRGNLKLQNSLDDVLILGNLDLIRGQLKFLSKTLELTEGGIVFDGRSDNVPILNVQAVLTTSDIKAIIRMQGRADRPEISLSSEPPMPQEEILSYVLFGRSRQSLTPLEAFQLLRYAVAMRQGGDSTDFFGMLENNLGLDQLSVAAAAGDKGASLRLGKSLSNRVHVSVNQGVKPEDNKAVLEFYMTPQLTLETEVGVQDSANNLSLKYNWDH